MSRYPRMTALLLAGTMGVSAAAEAVPIVFAHRGASAYRPEHTLAAYELAIDLGADYIEPDLVSTSDGFLVARHENEISGTTNVGTVFGSRPVTTKAIDGVNYTGYFTEDFTLAELKTLDARERIPALRPANTAFNDQPGAAFDVPTLQDVIDLVRRKEAETGRTIGIIPEIKHSTYHKSLGLAMERTLVDILNANGYNGADDPVFIQSFEQGNLIELNALTDVRLVQLTLVASQQPADFAGTTRTYADLLTAAGLAEVSTYADVLGPDKSLIIPRVGGNLSSPTGLVEAAQAAGLLVVPYTFRPENSFLPNNLRSSGDPAQYGDDQAEFLAFYRAGVDGLFADAPDRAVAARNLFLAVPEPATWMSMIAGFGLVGLGLRRRGAPAPA